MSFKLSVCCHRNWSTWSWRRQTVSCLWWRLRRVGLSTCRILSLPFWTSRSPNGLAARYLSRSIRMMWTNWGNSWAHLRIQWQVRDRSLLLIDHWGTGNYRASFTSVSCHTMSRSQVLNAGQWLWWMSSLALVFELDSSVWNSWSNIFLSQPSWTPDD